LVVEFSPYQTRRVYRHNLASWIRGQHSFYPKCHCLPPRPLNRVVWK